MAYENGSPLDQADKIYVALKAFYASAKDAVDNGGEFPSMSTFATQLDYSELLRYAIEMKDNSANYMTGSAIETIHLAAAVLREYSMRVKSKAEIYSDGVQDHENESQYYDSMRYAQTGTMKANGNGVLSS